MRAAFDAKYSCTDGHRLPPMLLNLPTEPVSRRLEAVVDSAEQQNWSTHSSVTLHGVEE